MIFLVDISFDVDYINSFYVNTWIFLANLHIKSFYKDPVSLVWYHLVNINLIVISCLEPNRDDFEVIVIHFVFKLF